MPFALWLLVISDQIEAAGIVLGQLVRAEMERGTDEDGRLAVAAKDGWRGGI